MRKLWKGIILGAAVGGTIKAVQEIQGEGDIDQVGPAVAKTAGQAAVVGAAVGFVLDRRDRRKLSKKAKAKAKAGAGLGGALAGAGALAEVAIPVIQHAAEVARDKAVVAAEAAKPHVIAAAEVASDKAQHAAKRAKPHVEHAADVTKDKASKAGKAAKAKLADIDRPVLIAV